MKESEEDEILREATLGALKLSLSDEQAPSSPEHPSTPPLQPQVSVPFRWEEEPGKPRSCPMMGIPPEPLKLELPPGSRIISGTPSPTSVLDGPGNVGRPKFSSFRFRSTHVLEEEPLFESNRSKLGLFARFKSNKRVVDGGNSCRFSPMSNNGFESSDVRVKGESARWNGSFSNNTKTPHFLATIYQGLKHAIQRKGRQKKPTLQPTYSHFAV